MLRTRARLEMPVIGLTFLILALVRSATAFNYVADANGTYWGIQDDAPPRVDTGSIRGTQIGPGQNPAFSTSINGFGAIRVLVQQVREADGFPDMRISTSGKQVFPEKSGCESRKIWIPR